VALEPVAACLLGIASRICGASGGSLVIRELEPRLAALIPSNDSPIHFDGGVNRNGKESPIVAARYVPASRQGNDAANAIADSIARFVPHEDREEMLRNQYGLRIHHLIQPALAHVLVELVDNVFAHAATQPKNHYEAAIKAFEPFVTSKGTPELYADRRHLGIGLAVCRGICSRLQGGIYAASGNAWVKNPGLGSQHNRAADPAFQGTVIALELHRRAVTSGTLRDVLAEVSGSADLRIQFG
jgi:hypothetical protein